MDIVWQVLGLLALACLFLSSLRWSLWRWVREPTNRLLRFATHPYWLLGLFVALPALMGEFARRETSPLPWVAHVESYQRHGVVDGLAVAMIVVTVEVWMFFGVSQYSLYELEVKSSYKQDPTVLAVKRVCYPIINVLVGLLLVSRGILSM